MAEAADEQEPDPAEIGTFYAFRFRNFRYLWIGNAFTSLAMWIQQTTLGWVVYDLTGSGSLLGAVNSLRTVPSFFISPLAGLAADRFSRNRIVGISQFMLFLNTFFLAAVLWLQVAGVGNLFLFALVIGVANAFNMPARQTMVFDVAPRHAIPNALALSNLAFSGMRTIGPMVGGILIVLFGPANNFFLQSLMYLGVLWTVWALHLPLQTSSLPQPPTFRHLPQS